MKHKKTIIILSISCFSIGLLCVHLFSNKQPIQSPQPTNPVVVTPTANQESSSVSSTQPPKTATRPRQVQADKHPASLLKSVAGAPEIPYYLLSTVNDPAFNTSWHLSKIQANRAWDLSTGSSNVTVAVIDTGFALNHEELISKWYTNSGETGTTQASDRCWTGAPANKQTNNCDDDNNGYVDDWRGWDFFNNDNSPAAGEVNPTGDGTQHATMVSGTIAAIANNGIGSTGIDQNARIMPLQVFSDNSEAYTTDLVAAIQYATDNGAKVINLSLGTNQYDALLLNAVRYARSHNVLVVVASGNCALNDQTFCNSLSAPGRMTYPALYPETLAVGATTSTDARATYSSYGDQLDMVAPGSSITPLPVYTSTNQTSAYATASGTSFASPLVAGVASLLIAQNPSITLAQLETALTSSTDKVSAMGSNSFTAEYGLGRLNAHKATLMGLAQKQTNLLGTTSLSSQQPSTGNVWRATTGPINNDEWLLVGCRVFESDQCSAVIDSGTVRTSNTNQLTKAGVLQYIFINGGDVPAGNLRLSVHNRNFAKFVTSLTK